MNKLIAFLIVSFTAYAWSLSYTSVAVDPSGQVCAGSIGGFEIGEYGGVYLTYSDGFLYCENGKMVSNGYGLADISYLGRDSILYSWIDIIDPAGSNPFENAGIGLEHFTDLDASWNLSGSNAYLGLRGVHVISRDTILLGDQNGLSVNNFALSNSRLLTGLPTQLASGPVRSLAKDFKNRLWAGTDSGVWVQDTEGDTTWTYHAVGWPVRNILPIDTHQVVVASFHMALDGYEQGTAKKACFENDSLRAGCSTPAYAFVNLCPRPGECFEVNSPSSGLHYLDHGVDLRAVSLPYIFDLAIAPNGKLWAATGFGLFSIDTATFVATREYIGLDTPVVATLAHASQQRLWNIAQQGQNLRVQSTVAGAVELIDLTGHRVSHAEVNREARTLAVPHAGVWLVRWTSVTGVVDVRRMVVN